MGDTTTNLGLGGLMDDDDFVLDLEGNMETGIPKDIIPNPKDDDKGTPPNEGSSDDIIEKEKEKDNTGDSEIIGLKKESVASKEGEDPSKTESGVATSPSEEDKTSQIYSSFAQHFQEAGVLPNLNLEETPIKNANDLADAVQAQIEAGLNAQQKAYVDAMKAGVIQSDYVQYQQQMDQLNSIDDEILGSEENQNLRMEIIARDFMNKGFPQEKALIHAQRSIASGDDVVDAKEALVNLKDYVKTTFDNKKQAAAQNEQKALDDIKAHIDKNDEFIKGVKLNEATKARLYKQITTPIATNDKGKPINAYTQAFIKDPVRMRVATEYMFFVTKGFTDFSKISQGIETKTTKSLDDLLKNNGAGFLKDGKVNFENHDKNSQFNLGEFEIDI